MMPKKVSKLSFQNKLILIVLVLLGSLSWVLTMVKSGLIYPYGMGFWGPNGHDGVWHIALAESLARGSFEMPTFAGEKLQNYHIGFDLLLAVLHKLTTIPINTLYFQILPALLGLAIGLLTYIFILRWRKSVSQALWAVFFVYFGGSFGWIITFFKDQSLGGESLFWSQQAVSTLINPPFALSLVVILLGLIWLQRKGKSMLSALFIALTFGVLIEIKAYAGVICIAALGVAGVFELVKNRQVRYLFICVVSFIVSALLLVGISGVSSSLLIWQPFWFLETMMGLSDRFNWPKYYEAMVNYKSGNSVKFLPAYGVAFAIFWFGNIGSRVVKEVEVLRWIKNYKQISFFEVFFSAAILIGIALPLLFLQKGTPWNTIQFLYYSLFFSSLLAGTAVGRITQSQTGVKKILFSILIVLLTIPTTIGTLAHYLPKRPPAKISQEELEALRFLAQQPNGVVLTYPFDKAKADQAIQNPPRPLYLYESTAYVSGYAKKPVYLEDQVNLDIMGYDWKTRREEVLQFYQSLDQTFVREFLTKNNIEYIYWTNEQRATLGETQLGITKIFENSEVDIYKLQK